jgi:HEAT repeats
MVIIASDRGPTNERFRGTLSNMSGRAKCPALALLMVMRLGLLPAFAGPADGGVFGVPSDEDDPPCLSLDACLAQLDARKASPANLEIDQFDRALAKALRAYGKAAVPHLLGVMGGADSKARDVAAYTLCHIDGLTEADTPALLRALAAGERWIAPAVARIGSPEAIRTLFGALKATPDYNANLVPAFKRLGRKGVPILLTAFDCRDGAPSDASDHRDLCQASLLAEIPTIFGELGPEAREAVAPLTKAARDQKRPWAFRAAAVESLGEIGESAASAAPALRQIARAEPKRFRKLVERALAGMKLPPPARPSRPASAARPN